MYVCFSKTQMKPTCSSIMEILHGSVICDSDTNSVGSSCKYQCDKGFKLVGTAESICSLDKDEFSAFWSQNPPFCEGKYSKQCLSL